MSNLPHGSQSSSGTGPFSAYSSDSFMVSGGGRAGDNIDNSGDPFADQESVQDQSGARAVEDPFSDAAEYDGNYDQNSAHETAGSPHKQAAQTERPKESGADDKKARGYLKSLNSVLSRPTSLRTSRARAASGPLSSFSQTAYSVLPSEAAKGSQDKEAEWSKVLDCVPVKLTMSKNWNTKLSYYDARGSRSAKFALDGTMALTMADQTDTVRPGKGLRPKHTGSGPLQIDVAEGLPVFSLDSTGPVTSIEKLPNDNAAVCLSLNREPIYCPRWVTSPNLDYQRVADEYETRNLATTSALSDV